MARQPRQPRAHPHLPKELDRYLFTTERDQFRLRQHWARLRWPISALILGAIIFLGLSPFLIGSTTFLVLAFFLLIIPLLWLIWAWDRLAAHLVPGHRPADHAGARASSSARLRSCR
jgi:hypothetical protein